MNNKPKFEINNYASNLHPLVKVYQAPRIGLRIEKRIINFILFQIISLIMPKSNGPHPHCHDNSTPSQSIKNFR